MLLCFIELGRVVGDNLQCCVLQCVTLILGITNPLLQCNCRIWPVSAVPFQEVDARVHRGVQEDPVAILLMAPVAHRCLQSLIRYLCIAAEGPLHKLDRAQYRGCINHSCHLKIHPGIVRVRGCAGYPKTEPRCVKRSKSPPAIARPKSRIFARPEEDSIQILAGLISR